MNNEKQFLYVGHYTTEQGEYILKIGTTNDLERRRKEHTRNYRRCKNCPMPKDTEFCYDWTLPLSKYNTLRYEDANKAEWQKMGIGTFIRNDRFKCKEKPPSIQVSIKKTYTINL